MLTDRAGRDHDSGVRVSCRPRSTPVTASTTSIAGMPAAETRRYVVA